MNLTAAQIASLKADVATNFANAANTVDGSQPVADAYNAAATPAFYVWRSFVSEAELVGTAGVDVANANAVTNWSWSAYIARSLQEINAWGRMMMTSGTGTGSGAGINPSRANIRAGILDIFSGGAATAGGVQRNHINVLSKRTATRLEKLLADTSGSGTGAYATPATLGAEGTITASEIWTIRNSS